MSTDRVRIGEPVGRVREGLSNWIARIRFLPLFLSMCSVKVLDTLFACATYLHRPSIFIARETNLFLYNALVHGNLAPFLAVEATVYLLFGIVALGLVNLAQYEGDFAHQLLTIPLAMIGALILWLYPVTMSTNIVNGILALGVTWPLSCPLYVITGFPLAWMVTQHGWNLKGPYITGFMLATMILISFQI